MADGRERQVSGHQRLAGRRQLPQKTDPDAGRFLGVVLEAVVPLGVVEPDREHGVAGERQPVAAGRQADHAVAGGVAAGATDDHPRRHPVLSTEAHPGTPAAWTRGRNRAPPRTRPRQPLRVPAGPDAAGPSPCSPTWSMCMWVSTTSVTDARSMPAASSRRANRPVRGKSGYSTPIPASMSMVRPPLRTTTTFSAHSSTSGGRNMSFSQAARTAGSALWANIAPGTDSTTP